MKKNDQKANVNRRVTFVQLVKIFSERVLVALLIKRGRFLLLKWSF